MAAKSYPPGPKLGFPANAAGFLFPPVVWAIYFVVVYSAQGAGCASALRDMELFGLGLLGLSLVALTVLALVAIAGIGIWAFLTWRRIRDDAESESSGAMRQSDFLAFGAILNAGLFFVATLWTGLPILLVDPCRG